MKNRSLASGASYQRIAGGPNDQTTNRLGKLSKADMSFTSKKDSMSSPWAKGTASPNHLTAASLLPIRPGNDQAIPNDTPAACIQHPKAYSFVWIPPDRSFFLLHFLSLSPSPLQKKNNGLFKKLKQKRRTVNYHKAFKLL